MFCHLPFAALECYKSGIKEAGDEDVINHHQGDANWRKSRFKLKKNSEKSVGKFNYYLHLKMLVVSYQKHLVDINLT